MVRLLVLIAFLVALGCAEKSAGERAEPLRIEVPPASAGMPPDASGEDAFLRLVHWRLDLAGVEAMAERGDGCVLVTLPARVSAEERAAAEALLCSLGRCEFFLVAEEGDVAGGLEAERLRFERWREEHPARPWLEYNADPARTERGLAWFPTRFGTSDGQVEEGRPMPVLLPRSTAGAFGSGDFERVYPTQDDFGYPAIGFELTQARSPAFADFTERIRNRRLAIVLENVVRSAPTLNSRLVGGGIIEGRFRAEDVAAILSVLQE